MVTHPVTLYWHRADQLHFMVPTMQAETTTIFNIFGKLWTQHRPGIKPTKPLDQCWVPPIVFSPFTISRGLLRAYFRQEAPSGAPTPDPRGVISQAVHVQPLFSCIRNFYGRSTKPRISRVVSNSDSDQGTATTAHRTLGLMPTGTMTVVTPPSVTILYIEVAALIFMPPPHFRPQLHTYIALT